MTESFKSLSLDIDDKTVPIECIATEYGDILVSATDYVVALTGCAVKDASNKLSSLYAANPLLRPPKQDLGSISKVSSTYLCQAMFT